MKIISKSLSVEHVSHDFDIDSDFPEKKGLFQIFSNFIEPDLHHSLVYNNSNIEMLKKK